MGRKRKSRIVVAKEQRLRMQKRREESVAFKGLASQNEKKTLAQILASPSAASEEKYQNSLSSVLCQGNLSIQSMNMVPTSNSPSWVCTPPRVPSPEFGVVGQMELGEKTSFDVPSQIESEQQMQYIHKSNTYKGIEQKSEYLQDVQMNVINKYQEDKRKSLLKNVLHGNKYQKMMNRY